MKKNAGFTLIELLIVIIIIVILCGLALVMSGFFMRGQGVRQGAMIMMQAVARTKQLAADQRCVHFLVFENTNEGGRCWVYRDANANSLYDVGVDQLAEANPTVLPRLVDFEAPYFPQWMGFNPSGYVVYNSGFAEVQAGTFDGAMAASAPSPTGDIVIKMRGNNIRVCMDVDKASGKIRRHQFLAQ
jgi:prepilin-type N-terminal cleavage/methylation domain-containing protein